MGNNRNYLNAKLLNTVNDVKGIETELLSEGVDQDMEA